jgi:hypothetical protein
MEVPPGAQGDSGEWGSAQPPPALEPAAKQEPEGITNNHHHPFATLMLTFRAALLRVCFPPSSRGGCARGNSLPDWAGQHVVMPPRLCIFPICMCIEPWFAGGQFACVLLSTSHCCHGCSSREQIVPVCKLELMSKLPLLNPIGYTWSPIWPAEQSIRSLFGSHAHASSF